jgi:hypothetical protein
MAFPKNQLSSKRQARLKKRRLALEAVVGSVYGFQNERKRQSQGKVAVRGIPEEVDVLF